MKAPSFPRLVLAFALAAIPTAGFAAAASNAPPEVSLFSFFRDNGQDGLYLAWSPDGLKWSEIPPPGKSFLQSGLGDKLMRDPCLRQGPDGVFRLVWTTGWGDRIIGYAESKDLRRWSEPRAIPVMMHEAQARNSWAPELFYDRRKSQWLIFWSTTIPGRFPETEGAGDDRWNHRIYSVTTRDFQTFSETRLFYDGGFNVIDATLFERAGKHYLVVKDETLKPVKKHLRIAVGDSAEGPFGPAGAPFTGDWVEGPSVVAVGDDVLVYFDHYAKPQYYGAVRSRDLNQWEDLTPRLSFPMGVRHGTVTRVASSVMQGLLQSTNPATGFVWPRGARAALSLTFDDARPSQITNGLALLEKAGVRATFFVSPQNLSRQLAGWKSALAQGHEIGNHTLSHPCTGNYGFSRNNALEDYTLERMAGELERANDFIEEQLGVRPVSFAYPCGQKFVGRGREVQSYVPLVAERFLAGRGYLDEAANDPTFCDPAQLLATGGDDQSFEELKVLVDQAIAGGRWLVLVGHEIGNGGFQTTRMPALEQICAYARSPERAVWVDTVERVTRYVLEHQGQPGAGK